MQDGTVMPSRLVSVLLLGSALVVASTQAGEARPAAGAGRTAPAAKHPMVAPYLDMGARHPGNLYAAIRKDRLRYFSAGFVISDGCTATWDDGEPVAQDPAVTDVIRKAKSLGARAVVSFGGQGGEDPARACVDQAASLAEYRSVVSTLHAKYLDFDVEGDALADPASIDRRFADIAALEKQSPHLVVSLTVPVLPRGFDSQGMSLLHRAKASGARIDLVNIMAMDYGGGSIDMGHAAISAAKAVHSQLRSIWPHSSYANLGITPMIGRNDDVHETFTVSDARSVRAFARKHHVGRLAFWALGRDRRCTPPSRRAKSDCSSVAQSRLAFTRAFLG
jgi:hypothetical protein